MSAIIFQPKGSMCTTCEHSARNCRNLPFHEMPVLQRTKYARIVRCTEFKNKEKP